MLFGETPIQPQALAERLTAGTISRVRSGKKWTAAVKEVLLELGKERKRYVAPDVSINQRGYMCDLLWFADSNSNDILLAVESEWGGARNVWEDFDKLMHIKAPLKVMILSTSRHGDQSEAILKGICELYMQKFSQHVEGEEYLLIEFVDPHETVHCHHYRVPKNGTLGSVRFEPLVSVPYPAQ